MDFISKLSKPLRNVQSFAIKHWKYIFVMFVLIAYIIHALFRKEGMIEYMDTSESGSTDLQEFTELVTDEVVESNKRLNDIEKNLQNLTNPNLNLDMSSGDGALMDDLNGQAGSDEEQQPPQTNVMQANSSASTAEEKGEIVEDKRDEAKDKLDEATTAYNAALKKFNEMYPQYSQ